MGVSFERISVGSEIDRPALAGLWGYKSHHAISKGVVTPKGERKIVLFVTREKQASLTQYHDFIEGDHLYWEGEEQHGSDARIISAANAGDEIHLFYRDLHHSPFVYRGRVFLEDAQLNAGSPSEFIFRVSSIAPPPDAVEDVQSQQAELATASETEKEALVKARLGQGRFRAGVIRLWSSCAVSGLTSLPLLRASHIKPWRACSNPERLDPFNGLLLQPNLDATFDAGLVSFSETGEVLVSSRLSLPQRRALGLSPETTLRFVPPQALQYLEYHRQHVFKR